MPLPVGSISPSAALAAVVAFQAFFLINLYNAYVSEADQYFAVFAGLLLLLFAESLYLGRLLYYR